MRTKRQDTDAALAVLRQQGHDLLALARTLRPDEIEIVRTIRNSPEAQRALASEAKWTRQPTDWQIICWYYATKGESQ